MTFLFSYNDADIYDRDLALFNPHQWLNDSCINFCFRHIENDIKELDKDETILLFDPSVTAFLRLQCEDPEDYKQLAEGIKLTQRKWLIIPITDQQSFEIASTHWSLLVINVIGGQMLHFDTAGSYNTSSANDTRLQIKNLFQSTFQYFKSVQIIKKVKCPQQQNGYDCGVYCILFAEIISRFLITNTENIDMNEIEKLIQNVQPEDCDKLRARYIENINEILSTKKVEKLQEINENEVEDLNSSKNI